MGANDSPCYVEQMHVNFKDYNTKAKPIQVNLNSFDPSTIKCCLVGLDGLQLVPKAGAGLASEKF